MALGGGKYTKQNKVLPGTYYDFKSQKRRTVTFSERGVVAVPMVLNWQADGLIRMQNTDAMPLPEAVHQWPKDALRVFGYPEGHPLLRNIREMFQNATEVFIYPLGSATKATNKFGTAMAGGVRGNDLAIVVDDSLDVTGAFDVLTYLGGELVDSQTAAKATDLVDTDFIKWNEETTLEKTASTPMTGGINATASGADYQKALDAFEALAFNILACPVKDETTKKLFAAWTKRLNDAFGLWHQLVLYQHIADSEYVISVDNAVVGDDEAALVYYVAGEQAGCAVQSVTDNRKYGGEYELVAAAKNQSELAGTIVAGKYVYHRVEGTWRVLVDNNTLKTFTDKKGEAFSRNQTIRVLHQRAIDSTRIFRDEFLGKAGTSRFDRDNYKTRLLEHANYLQSLGAIKNFRNEDVQVSQGAQLDAYHVTEAIQPNFAVRKIYHDILVAPWASEKKEG